MSVFSGAELTYLAKGKLGRLATIDGAGMPHVVPLGWRYNPALDTIDMAAGISPGPGNFTTR
jgi:pyridoxamine 5'-phosphate oxidase family protein